MKRCCSLGSAAILSLTLLVGTPSFAKGRHGSGHSAGHSSGHTHASGHSGGAHHASGHPAPSHAAPHPQLTHKPSTHPQHSTLHPTHPQPTHNPSTPLHTFGQVAAPNATVNNSGTNSGGSWHHGHHHSEWNTWNDGGVFPGYYNPYWNGEPGVVVVPAETEVIEQQYVTRVTPPAAPQSRSQNSDNSDPSQTNPAP